MTFGPKRDEVTGEWRELQNEVIDLYFSPNTIRVINQQKCDGRGMWHVWDTGTVRTGFW